MAEVYVEGKKLDVFQGFKFSFNYSIADIRHPEKRSTTYSKTIQCPGTQTNDEIFGQIYDFNISNGYDGTAPNIDVNFNPNKKAEASVQADGVEVMRGSIQLRKIKRKKSDYIYEVVFVGRLVDIFGVLGDKQLSGFEFDEGTQTNIPYIDFSDLDHYYTQANQQTSWTAPYGSGYVYPMLDYGSSVNYTIEGYRTYPVTTFKPALYLKDILDRIFAFAGFSYSSSFLSSDFFKRLIVPVNKTLTMPKEDTQSKLFYIGKNVTQNTIRIPEQNTPNVVGNGSAFNQSYSTPRIMYDSEFSPFFDNGPAPDGNFHIPLVYNHVVSDFWEWKVEPSAAGVYELTATAQLKCTEAGSIDIVRLQTGEENRDQFSGKMKIMLNRDGYIYTVAEEPWSFALGVTTGFVSPTLELQTNVVYNTITVIAESVDVQAGDEYYVILQGNGEGLGYTNYFKEFYAESGWINEDTGTKPYWVNLDIIAGAFKNDYLNAGLFEGEFLNVQDNLPEVGMADLILSVINMFNLYVLPDPNNDLNLLIETRDDFYEAGSVKDWTHKVDHSKELTLEPLALLTANEYEYTYTEDEDYYNERYQDSHGHAYGRARIDIDNDFLNNTNTTEVVFSPTPLVNDNPSNRIIGKIYDSDIEEGAQPTDHNIRVLYYGGLLESQPEWKHTSVVDDWNTESYYPYAGHLTHPLAPAQDINFGIPNELFYSQNSYTGTLLYTNDNLFNRYHRRGLLEATNKDSKMLTAYLYLEPLDIHKLDFRDQIVIDNSYWRINRIMDYNPFSEGLTKVELIKVITKEPLKVETFNVGSGGTTGTAGNIEKKPINRRSLKNGNSLPLFGGVVRGTDNTVEDGVTSFMVQGNRNRIKKGSEDITISGNDNTVEGGLRSVRLINTNGVTVTESNITFVNNRQQESSEVLDGGLDTVRRIGGGSNIFTVDGGLNIVQAQFSESSIYIIEGGDN